MRSTNRPLRPTVARTVSLRFSALALLVATAAACATATVGAGAARSESAFGWGRFRLGMSLEAARDGAGGPLELRTIEDRCGRAGARVVEAGHELFLGFTGDALGDTLQSIVLRLAPEATKERVVADLKRRFPGLRYRPDPRWPNMSETENPKPLYVHPDIPDQGYLVGTEEGWVWISYLGCLD